MAVRTIGHLPTRRVVRLVLAIAGVALVALTVVGFQLVRASSSYVTPEVRPPKAEGVSGFAFADRNGNGKHESDEPTLNGWKVSVFSTGPEPLTSTRSDSKGVFRFSRIEYLTPGETTVSLHVTPVMEGPAALPEGVDTTLEQRFTARLGAVTTIAVTTYRLCSDLKECPGVKLPDLRPILTSPGEPSYPEPTKYTVDTREKPGRVLLRFGSSVTNDGGLFHLAGEPVKPLADGQKVQQRIYGDGVVYVNEAGIFEYHPSHHHVHFGNFEKYELLSHDRRTVIRSADKVSFCVTDLWRVSGSEPLDGELFLKLPTFQCGAKEQGLNPGMGDYYGPNVPDQWIDVTGVPTGKYWIRITIDPDGNLHESNVKNNSVYIPVDFHAPGRADTPARGLR